MGSGMYSSGGSNEPPELAIFFFNIIYFVFLFDPLKYSKFFLKPTRNKFNYDHLNNILIFLNTKKCLPTIQFYLKFGRNSKPNNKVNFFFHLKSF